MAEDLGALVDYDSEDDSPFKQVKQDKSNTGDGTGFLGFLLKEGILQAISECGFEHPSQVQRSCIPQAILGNDILCQAKSGMGKTAVFVLSVLQQLEPEENTKHPACLVLCHTRELALQIQKEFDRFKRHLPAVRTQVVVGGASLAPVVKAIKEKTPHIVIGTPGAVLKLTTDKSKILDLSRLKYFIVDECDQVMESLELRKAAQDVFRLTPVTKQVMMFTATLSESTHQLCKRFMRHPHEIIINDGAKLTLDGLQQYFLELEERQKTRKLVELLDDLQFNQVMIFVNSVLRAENLNKILISESFPSSAGFGKMNQKARTQVYTNFKETKVPIMVTTDMFARGIDFERVNVVINYDMPKSEDTYLHRVGRAGRFGTKGVTISFVSSDADKEVLSKVRAKFSVDLPAMPAKIDPALYK